jgi:hypothetical protein
MRFNLYPIHWVAMPHLDPEPFDPNTLPFEIAEGVRIESIRFIENAFELHRPHLGDDLIEVMQRVRYAIVHRYNPDTFIVDGAVIGEVQHNQRSEQLLREVAACLRLIRPMRQHAMLMRGTVRDEDDRFDVTGFDVPNLWLHEVPEVQKLWSLRNRDCDELRNIVPEFLRGMRNNRWKFRMAVQFHELGFFQSHPEEWKARLLLWASAIESIYTSNSRDHQGSAVATERIKWFLGENTSIYAPGDLSEFDQDPHLTVGQMVNALYNVRNFVAHGDRVPDLYFSNRLRDGLNGAGMFIHVLFEAQSFLVRTSLLRMLRDGLLDHFADAQSAEVYFAANGLTNPQIRARQRARL